MKFTDLPLTLREFCTSNMKRKCDICKSYPKFKNYLYLCLICGELMCNSSCYPDENQTNANIKIHAAVKHSSSGIFASLNDYKMHYIY